jgi:hypothetical protein
MNKEVKTKTVSFTQFSNWFQCPNRWYLDYVQNKRKFEESLHMSFGTAIHETMQTYLRTLYNESEIKAERIDLNAFFIAAFQREVEKKKIPHTQDELNEFIEDGKNILNDFKRIDNRLKHFPTERFTLVDIEHDIRIEITNNIEIHAILDLVLKEKGTGKIKIIDIKTATNGWNNYQK